MLPRTYQSKLFAPGLAFNLFGIGAFLSLWLLWALIRDRGWGGLWLVVFPLSLALWAARRYSRFAGELVLKREELLHRRWGRERRIRFADAEAFDFDSGRGWCLRAGQTRIYIHDQLDGYLELVAALRKRVTVVPESCRASLPLLLRARPHAWLTLGVVPLVLLVSAALLIKAHEPYEASLVFAGIALTWLVGFGVLMPLSCEISRQQLRIRSLLTSAELPWSRLHKMELSIRQLGQFAHQQTQLELYFAGRLRPVFLRQQHFAFPLQVLHERLTEFSSPLPSALPR